MSSIAHNVISPQDESLSRPQRPLIDVGSLSHSTPSPLPFLFVCLLSAEPGEKTWQHNLTTVELDQATHCAGREICIGHEKEPLTGSRQIMLLLAMMMIMSGIIYWLVITLRKGWDRGRGIREMGPSWVAIGQSWRITQSTHWSTQRVCRLTQIELS